MIWFDFRNLSAKIFLASGMLLSAMSDHVYSSWEHFKVCRRSVPLGIDCNQKNCK